jgi:hypothetical protein
MKKEWKPNGVLLWEKSETGSKIVANFLQRDCSFEEGERNAKIAAAAPRLLDQLERILDVFRDSSLVVFKSKMIIEELNAAGDLVAEINDI